MKKRIANFIMIAVIVFIAAAGVLGYAKCAPLLFFSCAPLLLFSIVALCLLVLFSSRYRNPVGTIAVTLMGFLYVPFLLSFFPSFRPALEYEGNRCQLSKNFPSSPDPSIRLECVAFL